MGYSIARVAAVSTLTPRMIRVEFIVDDLAALGLPGCPDEAVGIYFPADAARTALPMELRGETWGYYDVTPVPDGRNYSVRAVRQAGPGSATTEPEPSTMLVDFIVHSRGPATLWAQRAQPGDEVAMTHGRGWYRPEADTDWQLLVADLAGLPALARVLEELPDTAAATAIVEVPDAADLALLPESLSPRTTLIPLVGTGNGHSASRLATTVAELGHPEGRGYCWFAAEAAESRAVRKQLRSEYRWARSQYDIIGYWRYDGEAWSERYARHGAELYAVYQRAIDEGRGEKAAAEEFDEALERAGL